MSRCAQARYQPGPVRGRGNHHGGLAVAQAVTDEALERVHEPALVVIDLHQVIARGECAPDAIGARLIGSKLEMLANTVGVPE